MKALQARQKRERDAAQKRQQEERKQKGSDPGWPGSGRVQRMGTRIIVSAVCLVLGALVAVPGASGRAPSAALTRGELRWLGRVTFGIDAAAVARYRLLGREKFL